MSRTRLLRSWKRERFGKRCAFGVKVPQIQRKAAGVQSESNEWKSLTNSLSPRIALPEEDRWT